MILRGLKFALFSALLMLPTLAHAGQYAVGISGNSMYVMNSSASFSGTTISSAASFNGLAVKGNTAYAVDSSGILHVIDITVRSNGTTIFNERKTISLSSNIVDPGSVAVDNNGVYVIDKKSLTTSNYAYITNINSSTPSISVTNIPYAPLVDIAGCDSGAVIVSKGTRPTYVTGVNGSTKSDTERVDATNYTVYPTAIAAGPNNYAYVTNTNWADSPGGSIAVVNAATGKLVDATSLYTLTGIIPQDIATFQIDSAWYLGVIGNESGFNTQFAWKIALDANGMPVISEPLANKSFGGGDYSSADRCTAIGNTFWLTNANNGTVKVLSTTNWMTPPIRTFSIDGISQVVGFTPDIDPVPEPSSLVALAGFAAGAFGMFRRRK